MLFSCKSNYTEKLDISYPNFNTLNGKCKEEFGGSFTFNKIKISNYYYIENKIGLHLAKDTRIDSIAIVVPKQFNMFRYNTECNINETDENLLVLSTNNNKSFQVYDKIISNVSMLKGQESIIKSNSGFIIQGDWGHSNKKFTNVYVNYYKSDFFIDSIRIESNGHYQYNKIKIFKRGSFRLKDYTNKYFDTLIALWDNSAP